MGQKVSFSSALPHCVQERLGTSETSVLALYEVNALKK